MSTKQEKLKLKGYELLIEHFGTAVQVAKLLGISKQVICTWKKRGIPVSKLEIICKLASNKFLPSELRPDLKEILK